MYIKRGKTSTSIVIAMLLLSVSLLTCVSVVLSSADVKKCQQCEESTASSSIRVSLRNHKDVTGQWTTQVALKQGQPNDGNNWLTDIDQNVVACDGGQSTLETVVNLKAPPMGSPTVVAPEDYELFPGVGFYKFHPEPLAWPYARRVCASEGGHLVILNSQREVDVAVQIYARHPNAGDWLLTGILEMGIHAEWFTLFGVPLEKTGFSRIFPGENNAMGPSDFGAMHRTGDYADVTVDIKIPFLCEIEL